MVLHNPREQPMVTKSTPFFFEQVSDFLMLFSELFLGMRYEQQHFLCRSMPSGQFLHP